MGKGAIRVLLVTLVMVLAGWGVVADLGSSPGAPGGQLRAYAPGELLVKYKPEVRSQAADYFRRRWGVSALRFFPHIGVDHVKLPAGMTVEEALGIYRNDPNVAYAEPNYYRSMTATPNDTDYQALLWGMNNTGQTICPPEGTACPPYPACVAGTAGASISAPSAWDASTDCTSVTAAIIDTGVDYNHPDLAGNIWSNPGEIAGNGIDDDHNGYVDDVRGWDFVDNDNAPMDANGHGSHVAGTIGAVGNNGLGVTGVCWTARLMPLRVLDAFGFGTDAKIIDAMEYAQNNGAKVINASFGASTFSQSVYDEIASLNSAGVLLVAAAGNNGTNSDSTPFYPASYDLDNIIAVAATDQNDNLACFSNYGQTSVDVAGPGANIYSTKPGRQTVFSDNFDDGDISDWIVDAPWGVSTNAYGGAGYSLADSPTGNYGNNINISARPTNAINLSGQTGTVLNFQLNGTLLPGDVLYVETSPDLATWTNRPVQLGNLPPFENGISPIATLGQWVGTEADLGSLDGTPALYFRFRLQTNGSGTADGVYIDNVQVTTAAVPEVQDTYQFLDGTSMATPHVTGLSALVWANNTSLTHLQVKERILNSVDRLPALSTTTPVFTQGRINAANSMRNVPAPPMGLAATAVSTSQINLSWANTYYGQIGFRIERQEGTSGTFTQIADLNSKTTSYSDAGLAASTVYTYRVRAYTSDNTSAYSAEASATTPAPPSSGGGGGSGGGCFIDTVLAK